MWNIKDINNNYIIVAFNDDTKFKVANTPLNLENIQLLIRLENEKLKDVKK